MYIIGCIFFYYSLSEKLLYVDISPTSPSIIKIIGQISSSSSSSPLSATAAATAAKSLSAAAVLSTSSSSSSSSLSSSPLSATAKSAAAAVPLTYHHHHHHRHRHHHMAFLIFYLSYVQWLVVWFDFYYEYFLFINKNIIAEIGPSVMTVNGRMNYDDTVVFLVPYYNISLASLHVDYSQTLNMAKMYHPTLECDIHILDHDVQYSVQPVGVRGTLGDLTDCYPWINWGHLRICYSSNLNICSFEIISLRWVKFPLKRTDPLKSLWPQFSLIHRISE